MVTRASLPSIRLGLALVLATTLLYVALDGVSAFADGPSRRFGARLSGFEEVPPIFTPARGAFEAKLSSDGTMVDYCLRYSGFTSNVAAAHIHFGQPAVVGGVSAWLCGGGGQQACPAMEGEVCGTLGDGDAAALPGIGGQGLPAGNLAALLATIRAGTAYVNVHSAAFPGGEIRGQIGRGRGGDDDD